MLRTLWTHARSEFSEINAGHRNEQGHVRGLIDEEEMGCAGRKVLGDHVRVRRALGGLSSGTARTVVRSVHVEDGFEA